MSVKWNYRLVRFPYGLMMREVYYDDDGNPTGHGDAGFERISFDKSSEIDEYLDLMEQALDRPVLSAAKLGW